MDKNSLLDEIEFKIREKINIHNKKSWFDFLMAPKPKQYKVGSFNSVGAYEKNIKFYPKEPRLLNLEKELNIKIRTYLDFNHTFNYATSERFVEIVILDA